MKVVINKQIGGFSLSIEAILKLAMLMGEEITFYKQNDLGSSEPFIYKRVSACNIPDGMQSLLYLPYKKNLGERVDIDKLEEEYFFNIKAIERHNSFLIQVVEDLGEKASGAVSSLKIVNIPDDIEYQIESYDGAEWVAEKHRTWH